MNCNETDIGCAIRDAMKTYIYSVTEQLTSCYCYIEAKKTSHRVRYYCGGTLCG